MRRLSLGIVVAAMAAAGLASTGGSAAVAAAGPCGTAVGAAPTTWDHVVLVIFENKNQDQLFKSGAAPYLTQLSQQCGRGTNMNTPDPLTSLGNYIALTSGYAGHPVHITSDRSPKTWPQDSVSIFEQTQGSWQELSESAPSNCPTGSTAFNFAVHHTAAPYYTRLAAECATRAVPLPATPHPSAAFPVLSTPPSPPRQAQSVDTRPPRQQPDGIYAGISPSAGGAGWAPGGATGSTGPRPAPLPRQSAAVPSGGRRAQARPTRW